MHKYKTHVKSRRQGSLRTRPELVLAMLLRKIYENNRGPVIIAIGGPGGTGKSTFCKKLAEAIGEAAILTLDDYKTSREERYPRNLYGAHPDANKIELVQEHLAAIQADKPFERPVYDAVTGDASETKAFTPARFTILDGEISTYRQFRDQIDFAVFIDSDWKTQLGTRISRDIEVRQYSKEKAIATFLQSNLREFSKYGAESKNWADMHIYCTEDYSLYIESVATEIFEHYENLLQDYLVSVDLTGMIVPVLTPFKDNGTIDKRAFILHLEYLATHGVRRILVNGTTGEFFSLIPKERKELLKIARRYFPGVVMFHAGSDSLQLSTEEVKWAEDFGADAVVSLPPYYLAGMEEEGLIEYFNLLAAKVEVPFILYNFPLHTQNPITRKILEAVPHFGLKDSSANLSLVKHTPHYYVGGDHLIYETFKAGGCGFVSGIANAFPKEFADIEEAASTGDWERAENLQQEINELIKPYCNVRQIALVKQALKKALPEYPIHVRPPLRSA